MRRATPFRLALLVPLLVATASHAGCAPRKDAATSEHLLFAMPHWCGPKGRGWEAWHAARSRAPTENAVCGVALDVADHGAPPAPADEDGERPVDGLCMVIERGQMRRIEVRAPTGTEVERVIGMPARDAPGTVDVRGLGSVAFRLGDGVIEAHAPGRPATRGPCFYW